MFRSLILCAGIPGVISIGNDTPSKTLVFFQDNGKVHEGTVIKTNRCGYISSYTVRPWNKSRTLEIKPDNILKLIAGKGKTLYETSEMKKYLAILNDGNTAENAPTEWRVVKLKFKESKYMLTEVADRMIPLNREIAHTSDRYEFIPDGVRLSDLPKKTKVHYGISTGPQDDSLITKTGTIMKVTRYGYVIDTMTCKHAIPSAHVVPYFMDLGSSIQYEGDEYTLEGVDFELRQYIMGNGNGKTRLIPVLQARNIVPDLESPTVTGVTAMVSPSPNLPQPIWKQDPPSSQPLGSQAVDLTSQAQETHKSVREEISEMPVVMDESSSMPDQKSDSTTNMDITSRVKNFFNCSSHKKNLGVGALALGLGAGTAYALGAFENEKDSRSKAATGSNVGTILGGLAAVGGFAYGAKKYLDHQKLGRESGEIEKSPQTETRAVTYETSRESETGCKMYPKSIIIGGIIGILSALVFVFYCLCSSKESNRRATVDLEMGLGDQ